MTQTYTQLPSGPSTPPILLDPKIMGENLTNNILYSAFSDLLRQNNDAQFGIVSTYDQNQNAWVRDATGAIPLKERIDHDHPAIEANNALLRCLSRLRPIDFAIEQQGDHQKLRTKMRDQYANLTSKILTISQDTRLSKKERNEQIKRLETEFNTSLVRHLHTAGLAEGCKTEKDAQRLLFYYRNLSSVLEPARTLITLTYDHEAKVFQRETQYPVTRKTPLQKETILGLKDNPDTSKKLAMQQADRLFADKMAADDTALPAQARKDHLVGSKNAFIVKNELIPGKLDEARTKTARPEDTLWLGRMGSPVYMKEAKEEVIQTQTRENLEQMRMAAIERMGRSEADIMHFHLTTLNTDSSIDGEGQDRIISHLREATPNDDGFSYAPINFEGTFHALKVSPKLKGKISGLDTSASGVRNADRLEAVSKIMLTAAKQPGTISLVNCASGQDRTGTAVEKTTQDWMRERYIQLGGMHSLPTGNIETMRAMGGNAAEVTTHHVHGSPGMKRKSKANNYFGWLGSKRTFSEETASHLYLKSSGTNKINTVKGVEFLKKSSEQAVSKAAFEKSLNAFETALNKTPQPENKTELYAAGRSILSEIRILAKQEPKKINLLKSILDTAHTCLTDETNTKENVKKLLDLTEKAAENKSSSWQNLATGVAYFCCAALFTAGIMFAIPTGGLSLLASAAATACAGKLTHGVYKEQKLSTSKEKLLSQTEKFKDELNKLETGTSNPSPAEPNPEDNNPSMGKT